MSEVQSKSNSQKSAPKSTSDQLFEIISPWLEPLGYQVIHLELQSQRHRVLRIFIDHLKSDEKGGIGIEDCTTVSRALDEKLDLDPQVSELLPGAYELEVSSPGADRPLRSLEDFRRFQGKLVKIHVYRPLSTEELDNREYLEKNPKQKNFQGTILGVTGEAVILDLSPIQKTSLNQRGKKGSSKKPTTNSEEGVKISIPLPLISKANLDPQFDFEGEMKES